MFTYAKNKKTPLFIEVNEQGRVDFVAEDNL
jgi:hypothetical protein